MQRLGLVGGTGLDHWGEAANAHVLSSVYGQPSADVAEFRVDDLTVLFLPRHGTGHRIPPHAVNYRANIDVLRQMNVDGIVAINAVGGISKVNPPGSLTVPDQLIDYTWGRAHSFSLTADDDLRHIEFAEPFAGPLRTGLIKAARLADVAVTNGGCLGVAQGPRLETAAEVRRCGRDGCDMLGMTSMPEAALAREAGLDYASLCVNANWAAGLDDEPVTMAAIESTLNAAMVDVRKVLGALFKELLNDN